MTKKKDKLPLSVTLPEQNEDLEKAREAFILEAESEKKKEPQKVVTKQNKKPAKKELPWEQPGVNELIKKSFNLRFSEPDYLKLKFVVEEKKAKSLHIFCLNLINKEVSKYLKKMG